MQRTPHSLARLAGALALALAAGSAFAQATPAGTWKTIDDNTGKQKGEVTIVENNGVFTGKVLSLIHISEPTRLDLASRMPSSA